MQRVKILGQFVGIEWALLAAIVAGGAFLRMEAHTHLTAISSDGVAYVFHSSQVLQGLGTFERRGPLFQSLLVVIYTVSGASFESSVLIPQFFGSIIPILMFLLGKRLFDSETGLAAALLVTLNVMLTDLSAWVLRETLSVTLILAFILIVHFSVRTRSSRKSLVATFSAGIIAGLIILCREEMIVVIPPAFFIYLFVMEKRKSPLLVKLSIFAVAVILAMAPWLVYSASHFGNPLYSYTIYVEWFSERAARTEDGLTGTSSGSLFLKIPAALLFGLWRLMIEFPALFSLLGLVFLPIGIAFTFQRRDLWIVYFILIADLIFASYVASWTKFFDLPVLAYKWSDPARFFFSTAIPFNVIVAAGVRKFSSIVRDLRRNNGLSQSKTRLRRSFRRRRVWRRKIRARALFSVRAMGILGILLLAVASYVPAYVLTFEYFDMTSARPFAEAADYLNSIGSKDGVFTAHPDLLAKYYDGAVFELPERGDFDFILREAQEKGVRYVLIESTAVTSLEAIRLYYKSIYPGSLWTNVPSEFVLVQERRTIYGLFLIQTEVWFKAAIFGTTQWESHAPWQYTIPLLGGSAESFDDTTTISNVDLSGLDIVVFADFSRPLDDTERTVLETAVRNGLTVVVSGLSPYYLGGGTSNLTGISSWFGATDFSEAPKRERWQTMFTEEATQITQELSLDRGYAFYTTADWSTPTGALAKAESIIYAYRANDQLATIFAHDFGEGTSIFVGPRFGFTSPDEGIFRMFIQSLIGSHLKSE